MGTHIVVTTFQQLALILAYYNNLQQNIRQNENNTGKYNCLILIIGKFTTIYTLI